MKYFLQRLKEPSTWNGISVVIGVVGYNLPAGWDTAGVTIATSLLAIVNIFWKKDSQANG